MIFNGIPARKRCVFALNVKVLIGIENERSKMFDRKAYNKVYYQTHKEHVSEQQKKYQLIHSEQIKAYCLTRREILKTYNKAYYLAHKKQAKDYALAYYQAHKKQVLIQKKTYYQAHSEQIKAKVKKRTNLNQKKEYNKAYYLLRYEQLKESAKAYHFKHHEHNKNRNRNYYLSNKLQIKTYWQSPKGKLAMQRNKAKRYRQLGFIPLNQWFKDSEAHHIDKEKVIYIPKELHESINHSLLQNRNMEVINAKALEFLGGGSL